MLKYKTLRLIALIFCFYITYAKAQDRYWVFLTDKNNVKFNPHKYFDKKAIERRQKLSLPLYDTTDFPVNKHYVDRIRRIANHVNGEFRWLNAVSISATALQVKQIRNLSFVREIIPTFRSYAQLAGSYDSSLRIDEKQILRHQLKIMEGEMFYNKGFSGKNIRIAIFDAGFPMLDEIPALKHIIENKRIVATWDFARKREAITSGNEHGVMVLSAIAGMLNGKRIGLATDAEFLLARTETDRNSIAEEEYWLQAVEWADKNGADIINSSLAYTYERYNTFNMNGKTSLIAKAANMAAEKGMLVINSMGNDGQHDWKIMATPADAEKVLSIGAIDRITHFHSGFSSYGPTADFRLKPNLVAAGHAIVASKRGLKKVKGTSFSAALITGFAACAWQSAPHLSNMELFEKLQKSGSLYPYFDYAHGYGVPKAAYFFNDNMKEKQKPTFEFRNSGDTIWIEVKKEYIDKDYFKNSNYLYYHIENDKHYLNDYWLVDVTSKTQLTLFAKNTPKPKSCAHIIRVLQTVSSLNN